MSDNPIFSSPLGYVAIALLIPVLGLVVGILYSVTSRFLQHRERMAMIEHGIHPDLVEPPAEDDARG